MEKTAYYQSPVGTLKITAIGSNVQSIVFIEEGDEHKESEQSTAISKCIKQLDEYFSGKRTEFDFPFTFSEGSEFQQKVWTELGKIPFGKTISYKELAFRLGDVNLIRAAGTANGKNPIAIVVPCHRVIGSDGKLVGYAGGLWRKQWLLEHEQKLTGTQQPLLF